MAKAARGQRRRGRLYGATVVTAAPLVMVSPPCCYRRCWYWGLDALTSLAAAGTGEREVPRTGRREEGGEKKGLDKNKENNFKEEEDDDEDSDDEEKKEKGVAAIEDQKVRVKVRKGRNDRQARMATDLNGDCDCEEHRSECERRRLPR